MLGIQQYNSSDDSNDGGSAEEFTAHLKPLTSTSTFTSLKTAICAAPDVVPSVSMIK